MVYARVSKTRGCNDLESSSLSLGTKKLPENPENYKQEELGRQAIYCCGDRVVEHVMESVERLEIPRFIFEEVAR